MNRIDRNLKAMNDFLKWMDEDIKEAEKREDERAKENQHRKQEGLNPL